MDNFLNHPRHHEIMNKKKLKRRIKRLFDPKLLMAYFVVFIMIGSGFGFVMNYRTGGGNIEYYNDHRLRQTEQGYILFFEGNELDFLSHPGQISGFDMPEEAMDILEQTDYFTVSFDPSIDDRGEMQYAISVIFQHLYNAKGRMVGVGVTEEDMFQDLQIFNCSDSTIQSPGIVFEEGDENDVTYDSNTGCIKVQSRDPMHRVQFADHLVYSLLGII